VRVWNRGDEPLSITGAQLPSPEMWIEPSLPQAIPPGDSLQLILVLAPREEVAISGTATLETSDPGRPTHDLQIETDVRELRVAIRALVAGPRAALGRRLTILVVPDDGVIVERGHLFYRNPAIAAAGAADTAFTDSVGLVREFTDFFTYIPGEAVREGGVEYYVEVENSGVFATAPPQGVSFQEVAAPAETKSFPKPNTESGFLEGRPIRIEVELPSGAEFQDGTLHYRLGGAVDYQTRALGFADASYAESHLVSTIPESLVTARGVEYWITVHTLTTTLTDPPVDPLDAPHVIQTTVQDLWETRTHAGGQYRMVSIPLLFGETFTGTLEALLSDQDAFGSYDPLRWRAFRYANDTAAYVELAEEGAEGFFRPVPGRAFWLIARDPHRISTAPISGRSTPTDGEWGILLSPGWNQVGHPFSFRVAWDSVRVGEERVSEAEGSLIETPVVWENGAYRSGITALEPFAGYWVKNLTEAELALFIPPQEATGVSAPAGELLQAPPRGPVSSGEWSIRILVSAGGVTDRENLLGICTGASACWDRSDRSEPPPAPGRSLSLYFPHMAWPHRPGNYTVDMRAGGSGLSWRFDVAKNFVGDRGADAVVLDFVGLNAVPAEAEICLVDRRRSRVVDLRQESRYRFHMGLRRCVTRDDDARFTLLIGSAAYVHTQRDPAALRPRWTTLHPAGPNPARVSTVITYDLAHAGHVTLRIYDAQGALVRTLAEGLRGPGRYEAIWQGQDTRGMRAPLGIYFCRLETDSGCQQTRRVALIR
jgi:hypothetical protein